MMIRSLRGTMLHDIILEIIVLGKHLIHNAKVVSFFFCF